MYTQPAEWTYFLLALLAAGAPFALYVFRVLVPPVWFRLLAAVAAVQLGVFAFSAMSTAGSLAGVFASAGPNEDDVDAVRDPLLLLVALGAGLALGAVVEGVVRIRSRAAAPPAPASAYADVFPSAAGGGDVLGDDDREPPPPPRELAFGAGARLAVVGMGLAVFGATLGNQTSFFFTPLLFFFGGQEDGDVGVTGHGILKTLVVGVLFGLAAAALTLLDPDDLDWRSVAIAAGLGGIGAAVPASLLFAADSAWPHALLTGFAAGALLLPALRALGRLRERVSVRAIAVAVLVVVGLTAVRNYSSIKEITDQSTSFDAERETDD